MTTSEMQTLLIRAGFLDPRMVTPRQVDFTNTSEWRNSLFVPDGKFGPQTGLAMGAFLRFIGSESDEIDDSAIEALVNFQKPAVSDLTPQALRRVIAYMEQNGMWVCLQKGAQNIVYLEGVTMSAEDAATNQDAPDGWNDIRLCFTCTAPGLFQFTHAVIATTEPGRFYTDQPLNSKGAARIAFGQYKAWCDGIHNGQHAALVQCENILVHRDGNRNSQRDSADFLDLGVFHINQHTTSLNFNGQLVGRYSAGCLVGKDYQQHTRTFMPLVLSDPRYLIDKRYTFITAVLPGDKVYSNAG